MEIAAHVCGKTSTCKVDSTLETPGVARWCAILSKIGSGEGVVGKEGDQHGRRAAPAAALHGHQRERRRHGAGRAGRGPGRPAGGGAARRAARGAEPPGSAHDGAVRRHAREPLRPRLRARRGIQPRRAQAGRVPRGAAHGRRHRRQLQAVRTSRGAARQHVGLHLLPGLYADGRAHVLQDHGPDGRLRPLQRRAQGHVGRHGHHSPRPHGRDAARPVGARHGERPAAAGRRAGHLDDRGPVRGQRGQHPRLPLWRQAGRRCVRARP